MNLASQPQVAKELLCPASLFARSGPSYPVRSGYVREIPALNLANEYGRFQREAFAVVFSGSWIRKPTREIRFMPALDGDFRRRGGNV
jgi:hypothetical protein